MLLDEFLLTMGITQRELADAVNAPYQRIRKRGISPSTALRLAKFFGGLCGFLDEHSVAVGFVFRNAG